LLFVFVLHKYQNYHAKKYNQIEASCNQNDKAHLSIFLSQRLTKAAHNIALAIAGLDVVTSTSSPTQLWFSCDEVLRQIILSSYSNNYSASAAGLTEY
jgi:hypothetical protein